MTAPTSAESPTSTSPTSSTTATSSTTVAARGLRIAMVGQKGVPATIGGVEHHVEEIGSRLAARGHDVLVYSRSSYSDLPVGSRYRGMQVVSAPTIGTKHLDAIVHSAASAVKAIAAGVDIVHFHALGPGLASPLPRYLSAAKVVLTVHGLDNTRDKWGRVARTVLDTAHWMSGHVPDRTVVVSRELQEHYRTTFGAEAAYITNGVAAPARVCGTDVVQRLGLVPAGYAMFVGRLVPEKRPDLLIRAFRATDLDRQLAIVGSSSFTDSFTAHLRDLAGNDPRIVFTGFVGGSDLHAVFQNASLVVQPSDVEGLPLTLLEAVAHGCHVLASDIGPHREVIGDKTIGLHRVFPRGDQAALQAALLEPVTGDGWDDPARDRVLEHYSWDRAALQLEDLYVDVVGPAKGRRFSLPRPGRTSGTTP
ncbi:MAG: glycosyltransferase family 4 protein [Actinomycetota bacterium]|nr:glycosyltransferase family 4 protein [Actinomycetota bacterium]